MRQSDLAGDLHIFQHVFNRKLRLKIAAEHFRQLQRQSARITGIRTHRFDEFFQRQT